MLSVDKANEQYLGIINKPTTISTNFRVIFHTNGQKHKIEPYVNGELDGLYQSWHENGTKNEEISYINGKRHGSYKSWWSNGNKRSEMTYIQGKIYGTFLSWHYDGTKWIETTYINDKREGQYKQWYLGGSFIFEFKNDTPIRVISMRDDNNRECVLPSGDITVWKAGRSDDKNVFIQLTVPKEVRRTTPIFLSTELLYACKPDYMSRIDYAKVEKIIDEKGNEYKKASSRIFDGELTKYEVGKIVYSFCSEYSDNITKRLLGESLCVRAYQDHCNMDFDRLYTKSDSSCVYEYCDGHIVRVINMYDKEGRDCVLPKGAITVWKTCKSAGKNVYVHLYVPGEARRITPVPPEKSLYEQMNKTNRYKSRIEFAQVLKIVDKDDNEYEEAVSCICLDKKPLVYTVGEFVYPDYYNDDVMANCGAGINVHMYKDHCDYWFS
jgi:antitoxin component YwqK of YwqJK toxin-antitoxin module